MRAAYLAGLLLAAWKEKERVTKYALCWQRLEKPVAFSMQMEIGNEGPIRSELSGSCFLIPVPPPLRVSASFLRTDPVPALPLHRCGLAEFSAAPTDLALCQQGMEVAVLRLVSRDSAEETCEWGLTCPSGMVVFAWLAGFTSEPHSSMENSRCVSPWAKVLI